MSEPAAPGRPALPAAILGLGVGAAVFAATLGLGGVVHDRLFGADQLSSWILMAGFGLPGLYGGWLVGLLVYSSLRGRGRDGSEP